MDTTMIMIYAFGDFHVCVECEAKIDDDGEAYLSYGEPHRKFLTKQSSKRGSPTEQQKNRFRGYAHKRTKKR
jgi:hypothetical protein